MELPTEIARLPIAPLLPELVAALAGRPNAVLEAPPGAGKSTGVPLALLQAPWRQGRILMLEPRRLAARAVAMRVASLLGEETGQRIGLRSRLETRVSRRTELEVVTEGVLTRMLQSDPALEGFAIVVFDEFHERSLNADLGLALCLDAQANLRPALRLLVMSATLDAGAVSALLGDATVLSAPGRVFPVELCHQRRAPPADLPRQVAATVRTALDETAGDLLVFLPGGAEIRRVASLLQPGSLPENTRVQPLFGDLPASQQDAALASSPAGTRKVVLATAIAETSLTVEGVTAVIDSGLSRRSRFDPVTGMSGLVTVRTSRAAADQRAGRAGRTAPGHCYRLWPERETARLEAALPAEILEADLAPLALELAAWGIADPAGLRLLDPPPAASLAQARGLLLDLGALGPDGRITAHGREMAGLGLHPRLAHLLLTARGLGLGRLGAEIAALLGERDPLHANEAREDADLRRRLELLRGGSGAADRQALQRIRRQAGTWCAALGIDPQSRADINAAGALLALAYPDRIGQSRGRDGRFLLSGGRGAMLRSTQSLGRSEFLVAAALDAASGEREARIFLAAPLTREELERVAAHRIEQRQGIEWDPRARAVVARRETRLGALLLSESQLPDPDSGAVLEALLGGLSLQGADALPWTAAARLLQARAGFVRRHDHAGREGLPAMDDEALLATLREWLAPWLDGISRASDLASLDLAMILRNRLGHGAGARLDELAPERFTTPAGSAVTIDYSDPDRPTASARLQEMFGLAATPRLAGGAVPLTLQLLSPARRPVQVTADLGSFWRNGYAEVRRELRGRYPRHHWPEDPLDAAPTRRVRPRR